MILVPNHRVVPQGLVGHWGYAASGGSVSAAGTVKDGSGHRHDMALQYDAAVGPGGIQLDGTGDYANGANDGCGIVWWDNVWTMAAWYRITDYTASRAIVGWGYGEASPFGFAMLYCDAAQQYLKYFSYDGYLRELVGNAGELSAGVWYHAAITNHQKAGALYLNGALIASGACGCHGCHASYNRVRIGWSQAHQSSLFAGDVDDVRIYNHALSAGEIKLLYQCTRRG